MLSIMSSTLNAAQLIELYRRHECLWNPRVEDYRNEQRRREAYNQIAYTIGCNRSNWADVKLKIEGIRSLYRKELKRVKRTAHKKNPYRPQLVWFNQLHEFLKETIDYRDLSRNATSVALSSTSNVNRKSEEWPQSSEILKSDVASRNQVDGIGEYNEKLLNFKVPDERSMLRDTGQQTTSHGHALYNSHQTIAYPESLTRESNMNHMTNNVTNDLHQNSTNKLSISLEDIYGFGGKGSAQNETIAFENNVTRARVKTPAGDLNQQKVFNFPAGSKKDIGIPAGSMSMAVGSKPIDSILHMYNEDTLGSRSTNNVCEVYTDKNYIAPKKTELFDDNKSRKEIQALAEDTNSEGARIRDFPERSKSVIVRPFQNLSLMHDRCERKKHSSDHYRISNEGNECKDQEFGEFDHSGYSVGTVKSNTLNTADEGSVSNDQELGEFDQQGYSIGTVGSNTLNTASGTDSRWSHNRVTVIKWASSVNRYTFPTDNIAGLQHRSINYSNSDERDLTCGGGCSNDLKILINPAAPSVELDMEEATLESELNGTHYHLDTEEPNSQLNTVDRHSETEDLRLTETYLNAHESNATYWQFEFEEQVPHLGLEQANWNHLNTTSVQPNEQVFQPNIDEAVGGPAWETEPYKYVYHNSGMEPELNVENIITEIEVVHEDTQVESSFDFCGMAMVPNLEFDAPQAVPENENYGEDSQQADMEVDCNLNNGMTIADLWSPQEAAADINMGTAVDEHVGEEYEGLQQEQFEYQEEPLDPVPQNQIEYTLPTAEHGMVLIEHDENETFHFTYVEGHLTDEKRKCILNYIRAHIQMERSVDTNEVQVTTEEPVPTE